MEKEKLATHQFEGVSQVQYNPFKEGRHAGVEAVEWEIFMCAFLDSFFSLEMRESNVQEFHMLTFIKDVLL